MLFHWHFYLTNRQQRNITSNTTQSIDIKSIDIMTLNIIVVRKAIDIVWLPYTGAHMLTGSLPEKSKTKYSHIVRLGNNWQSVNCCTSLLSMDAFLQLKQFLEKCGLLIFFSLLCNKSDYKKVLSYRVFLSKKFKANLQQISSHD